MSYVLSLLPVLACPLGMGAIIWLMMRAGREQPPVQMSDPSALQQGERRIMPEETHSSLASVSPTPSQSSLFQTIWDCIQMCLNWKVLVGLVIVAALLAVLNPALFATALPVLLVLVCPLSMGIMLLRMGRMRQAASSRGMERMTCCAGQTGEGIPAEPHQIFEQPLGEQSPMSPRATESAQR